MGRQRDKLGFSEPPHQLFAALELNPVEVSVPLVSKPDRDVSMHIPRIFLARFMGHGMAIGPIMGPIL